MIVSLISILIVLRLSFSLQQGFRVIRSGLRRLEADLNYRIPDQSHELAGFVQAINSMAENRQRLEAELRREDRLRSMGRVVAGIAHEIRNPLNSIRLTASVLARRLQDNPTTKDQIDMITGEIDRLDALLKSLLLFRQEEPGAVYRQPVLPIIERSLAVVQPHAQERGVLVRLEQPDQGDASVDSGQLQQAMMNLLLNAVDASIPGGVVSVRMQTAENHIDIAVEDSGPGLSVESQEQVFEAFYTTNAACRVILRGFFSAYSAFFAAHLGSELVEFFQCDALRCEHRSDHVTAASGDNVAMRTRNLLNEVVRAKHSQQA